MKNKINFRTLSIVIKRLGGRNIVLAKIYKNANIRGRMREVSAEAYFSEKNQRERKRRWREMVMKGRGR